MIWWFLPIILSLGFVTSYTDIKGGKIKNKHLLIAWIYVTAAYSIIAYTNWNGIGWDYLAELLTMSVISLAAGFLMWHIGIWTAGDAKLFFTYSLAVPLSVYKNGYVSYFNSFHILINTFFTLFPLLFLVIMLRTTFKQKITALKKAFDFKYILSLVLSVFAISWVIEWAFKFLKIPIPPIALVFLLFFAIILLGETKFNLIYVFGGVAIARLFLDPRIYSFQFLIQLLWILFLFITLRLFMIRLSFSVFTKEVNMNQLQKGMVPAEVIYFEAGDYKKERFMFFDWFKHLHWGLKKKYIFNPAEPLSSEDITKLKEISTKLEFNNIRIQQTLPFAPFMFFGTLLTFITQGSVFVAVEKLLF